MPIVHHNPTHERADIAGPSTNTDNNVPQWDGANTKTLKDGLALGTSADNLLQLDGSAKIPAVDGSQLTNVTLGDGSVAGAQLDTYVLGDTLYHSNDAETSSNATNYTKTKEIVVYRAGALRIKWDMKTGSGSYACYGKIYRNGSPVGVEKTDNNTGYLTQSDDIAGWSAGDLLQLYIENAVGGWSTFVQNERLYIRKWTYNATV